MIAGRPITGRTVLFGMVAFFGVVIAVNLAFVYFALDSWPGLGVEKAYEKGLAYNQTLAAADAQARLGWRSEIEVGRESVTVRMLDAEGAPLAGLGVAIDFQRAVAEGHDVHAALRETAPGTYVADVALPFAGRWNAEVRATAPGERQPRYRIVHELTVGQ